eukprot:TRINITY_DN19353_c0_g2_i1.p1 TRINITY_DN19353_c0_g2~~TRINITY_DN19353_c0_g2_i1.p1  ORF type:complete len:647 (-),score=59.03 TRINITY_DN19353_c0_g2_i1:462-2285(-)
MYIAGLIFMGFSLIGVILGQQPAPENDWRCTEVPNSCLYGFCRYECLKETCNAQQTFIVADEVIVLDYNSLYYHDGGSHPVVIASPAACCDECKRTEGCNAYAFCDNPAGCGAGCAAYAAEHPEVDPYGEYPFEGFGPFASCIGDLYPHQMCSLLKVKYDNDFTTSNEGKPGFVSGVLDPKPTRCGELNRYICEACDNAEDFDQCFACATQTDIPRGTEQYCAVCSDLSDAYQDVCSECLGEFGVDIGCGGCMRSLQPELCLQCTENVEEPTVQYECGTCADRENFQLCVDCLESDLIDSGAKEQCTDCTKDSIPLKFQQKCVECMQREGDFAGSSQCGSCAQSATNLTQCFQCLELLTGDAQRYCAICSTDKNPQQCYQCLKTEEVTEKVHCSTCALRSQNMNLCVECLKGADSEKALQCTKCAYSADEVACLNCFIDAQDESAEQECSECDTVECYQSVNSNNNVEPRSQDDSQPVTTGSGISTSRCLELDGQNTQDKCVQCVSNAGTLAIGGCFQCALSNNPDVCFDCIVNTSNINSLIPQMCPTCASLSIANQRSNCITCLQSSNTEEDGFRCQQCARLQSAAASACFRCMQNNVEDKESCLQ